MLTPTRWGCLHSSMHNCTLKFHKVATVWQNKVHFTSFIGNKVHFPFDLAHTKFYNYTLPDMIGHKAPMCTFCKPGENVWAKLCYDKYYYWLRGGVSHFDWNHFLGC